MGRRHDSDGAAVRSGEPGDGPHERRLVGAVRTEQCQALAVLNRQIDPGDSWIGLRGIGVGDVVQREHAETRIIYRQETDQLGATGQTLGLTGTDQRLLPGLGTGQGLWKITDRSFVVQHQLHPDELTMFDTTRMVS
jgi:hypothetical protein